MFCSNCAHDLGDINHWPYTCSGCGKIFYRNPIPVVVCLINGHDKQDTRHWHGVVLIRRTGGLSAGKWALPGGFMEYNDLDWQHSASREVLEETGLIIPPDAWQSFDLGTARDKNLLVFVKTNGFFEIDSLNPYKNTETDGIKIVFEPEELAFPLHTEALKRYLS